MKNQTIYEVSFWKKIAEHFIVYAQIFWYFVWFVPVRVLYRATSLFERELEHTHPGTLIVSNHQSLLDPFIALSYLPFQVYRKLLPVRFPVMSRIIRRWYVRPAMIFGAYDIGETKRERMLGLLKTKSYLKRRQSVMIFPEGKISKDGELQELQKGILFLAESGNPVLFAKFENFHLFGLTSLFSGHDLRITFNHLLWQEQENVEPAVFKSFLQ
jgi:1-acyl-sn-glycerol-3-phosphate acyltransferase